MMSIYPIHKVGEENKNVFVAVKGELTREVTISALMLNFKTNAIGYKTAEGEVFAAEDIIAVYARKEDIVRHEPMPLMAKPKRELMRCVFGPATVCEAAGGVGSWMVVDGRPQFVPVAEGEDVTYELPIDYKRKDFVSVNLYRKRCGLISDEDTRFASFDDCTAYSEFEHVKADGCTIEKQRGVLDGLRLDDKQKEIMDRVKAVMKEARDAGIEFIYDEGNVYGVNTIGVSGFYYPGEQPEDSYEVKYHAEQEVKDMVFAYNACGEDFYVEFNK